MELNSVFCLVGVLRGILLHLQDLLFFLSNRHRFNTPKKEIRGQACAYLNVLSRLGAKICPERLAIKRYRLFQFREGDLEIILLEIQKELLLVISALDDMPPDQVVAEEIWLMAVNLLRKFGVLVVDIHHDTAE